MKLTLSKAPKGSFKRKRTTKKVDKRNAAQRKRDARLKTLKENIQMKLNQIAEADKPKEVMQQFEIITEEAKKYCSDKQILDVIYKDTGKQAGSYKIITEHDKIMREIVKPYLALLGSGDSDEAVVTQKLKLIKEVINHQGIQGLEIVSQWDKKLDEIEQHNQTNFELIQSIWEEVKIIKHFTIFMFLIVAITNPFLVMGMLKLTGKI